eukprot:GGOE01001621.1.p1 GENE.GGOE01001621.1~~GGOE01001621.1.p1  ORF type:complete len:442 (+),score=95.42 GGOE01001621.1:50-1375(+)
MNQDLAANAGDYYQQFKHWNIDQKIYHTTCVIVSLTILGCVLVYLKFILVPLTLAFFFTYFLAPLVDLLTMRPWALCSAYLLHRGPGHRLHTLKPMLDFLMMFKFPKWIAVIFSFFLAFMLFLGTTAVIAYSVDEFIDHSEKYAIRINEVTSAMSSLIARFGLGTAHSKEKVLEYLAQLPLGTLVAEAIHSIIKLLMEAMLIMIIVIYLLLGNTELEKSAIRKEIDTQIRQYIVLKVLISASFGLLQCLTLLMLKVDLAVIFGVLCFILNFVPNVGPIIGILLPLPLVLLDPDRTWLTRVLAIMIPAVLSFIFGWIVEPSFFGSSMQLNEIAVLVALVFWGALWGIAGAVLSVPILVVAKICLEKVEHPIAQYMLRLITGADNYRTHFAKSLKSPLSPSPTAQQEPSSPVSGVPPPLGIAVGSGASRECILTSPAWVKATH